MGLYTAELHAKAAESATASITFASTAKTKGKLTFGGTGSDDETDGGSASQSDTVTISEEARTKASTDVGKAAKTDEAEETKSSADKTKEKVLKRIKEIQKRIQELQADASLSDDEKTKQVQALQTELVKLMSELESSDPNEYKGGTRAKGAVEAIRPT